MNNLNPYWKILRQLGIDAPCRVYLAGAFEADEVVLRFLLHKLGFTLLGVWEAKEAEWMIVGRKRTRVRPSSVTIQTREEEIMPRLFEAGPEWHLLSDTPSSRQRRHNLLRLLHNENIRNLQLGLALLDGGGVNTPLLQDVLAAYYLQRRQEDTSKGRVFYSHIAPWLPNLMDISIRGLRGSLPFSLWRVKRQLPAFSPLGFLQRLEEAQYFPFKGYEWMKGLYKETVEERKEAWRQATEQGIFSPLPDHLWLLGDLPFDGWEIELTDKLGLGSISNPQCLRQALKRHRNLLSRLKVLKIGSAGKEVLQIVGQLAEQLEVLSLNMQSPLPVTKLLSKFHSEALEALVIYSGRRNFGRIYRFEEHPDNLPSQVAGIRRLFLNGFGRFNLEGIAHFKNLRVLSLNGNGLRDLPPEIGELPHLKKLSLFEPRLEHLPDSFFKLPLEQIWIGSNQLSADTKAKLRRAFPPDTFRNDKGL